MEASDLLFQYSKTYQPHHVAELLGIGEAFMNLGHHHQKAKEIFMDVSNNPKANDRYRKTAIRYLGSLQE